MNQWKEQKEAFLKLAIETGIGSFVEIPGAMPLGSSIERERLEKWLRQLVTPPKRFSAQRRYVNRFKLGADPEFVFSKFNGDEGRVTRVDAQRIGLAQGPAFGADNNGRLAEIRPYPSRSVVNVVASILTTLRWMAVLAPNTLIYEWNSGAFIEGDGIGGHIHFGRKRPFREREIRALDAVEEGLLGLGCFPREQINQRRGGDARRQIYGMPGDFRLQTHGYEYRTYPSWLDSPELAFLTIVVSKLAVQNPALYSHKSSDRLVGKQRLINFLGYFKNCDDDARLALVLLNRLPFPVHRGGDFKARWGIPSMHENLRSLPKAEIVPLSIKPDEKSKEEIFNYLFLGEPLKFRVPEFTWGPLNPPKGFEMCLKSTRTILAKGLGEMIWDLCTLEKEPVALIAGQRGYPRLCVNKRMIRRFPQDWKKKFEGLMSVNSDCPNNSVQIALEFREGENVKQVRRVLLNGVLPIWQVGRVKPEDGEAWLKNRVVRKKNFDGEVLFSEGLEWEKLGSIGE